MCKLRALLLPTTTTEKLNLLSTLEWLLFFTSPLCVNFCSAWEPNKLLFAFVGYISLLVWIVLVADARLNALSREERHHLEEFWRFYYDITVFCPVETFFLGANKTLFSGFLASGHFPIHHHHHHQVCSYRGCWEIRLPERSWFLKSTNMEGHKRVILSQFRYWIPSWGE